MSIEAICICTVNKSIKNGILLERKQTIVQSNRILVSKSFFFAHILFLAIETTDPFRPRQVFSLLTSVLIGRLCDLCS